VDFVAGQNPRDEKKYNSRLGKNMKIALVHDYLSQDGGAERVLRAMHEIWPEAPIFVLIWDKKKIDYFEAKNIKQSFMAYLPLVKKLFQWYLPLMPLATEKHDLREFDVVLSSTSSFAKGVLTKPDTLHITYCHTPPRYLWTDAHQYIQDLRYNHITKIFLSRIIHKLRIWDNMSADRVDHFLANSQTVARRISKYYRRPSDVINPPIDIDKYFVSDSPGRYFVAGGRLVPYKRIDIIISAFNRLGLPLKVFGAGSEEKKLKKMAKKNIEFLGRISDEAKASLFSSAKAFLHPQLEDFGITPLEAMACGVPVIAYGAGGATETIEHGINGLFFGKQDWQHLFKAIKNFEQISWDKEVIKASTQKYSRPVFKDKIKQYVEHRYEEFKKGLNQPALQLKTESYQL